MKTETNFEELIRRQAEQVFGSKAKANIWLSQPRTIFSGATALECVCDEAGYRRVRGVLERIEHGYVC
ncbi:MbcA/ParS/Xre antitoxin family protein [Pseudomonas sp. BNK-43-a]|uniref:MbcA/ParS/Xre antitoxin family protein n=1 Tax=unclassified Pseudomonas TaxID=196821 RepID=UPI0039BF4432